MPYLVMAKIFGFLTIDEKLRIDPVSKNWRDFVTVSLRSETDFHLKGLDDALMRFRSAKYWDSVHPYDVLEAVKANLKALFDRMRDPETGSTNLRSMQLKLLACAQDSVDWFPKLDSIVLTRFDHEECMPYFILGWVNLRSVTIGAQVLRRHITLLVTECSGLKELDVGVYTHDLRVYEERRVQELYKFLEGAACSLESVTVDSVPAIIVERFVKTFPGLKEFHLHDKDWRVNDCSSLPPLRELPLRVLDLGNARTQNYLTYDLLRTEEPFFEQLFDPKNGEESPLASSLEVFQFGVMEDHDFLTIGKLNFLQTVSQCRKLKELEVGYSNDSSICKIGMMLLINFL